MAGWWRQAAPRNSSRGDRGAVGTLCPDAQWMEVLLKSNTSDRPLIVRVNVRVRGWFGSDIHVLGQLPMSYFAPVREVLSVDMPGSGAFLVRAGHSGTHDACGEGLQHQKTATATFWRARTRASSPTIRRLCVRGGGHRSGGHPRMYVDQQTVCTTSPRKRALTRCQRCQRGLRRRRGAACTASVAAERTADRGTVTLFGSGALLNEGAARTGAAGGRYGSPPTWWSVTSINSSIVMARTANDGTVCIPSSRRECLT